MASLSPVGALRAAQSQATPAGPEKDEVGQERRRRLLFLRAFRLALRAAGAMVSLSFAFQGGWIFVTPRVQNFWQFCHWVGKALLGIIAGFAGCFLEVKGWAATGHFRQFALNRVGSSIFYLWLGFYVMGGDGGEEDWMQLLMFVTGIVAWAVSLGDLMVSCSAQEAAEAADDPDFVESPQSSPSAPAPPQPSPQPSLATSKDTSGSHGADHANKLEALAEEGRRVAQADGSDSQEQTGACNHERPVTPPGGWNTGGFNPFAEP